MKYKLGILGIGKMGNSILSGIIKSGLYSKEEVFLYDVNEVAINNLINIGFNISSNESELFNNCECVIIAIKPQMFSELQKIELNNDNLVVISIAAGKKISDLEKIFGEKEFIRVMPNTPAFIGSSASAISRGKNVSEETFLKAKAIFESIGIVEEISEDKMNEIIPVNGSMPAYLYYFVEAFVDAAVEKGINYETAKRLACEAVIGSAKMILESSKPIKELINDVCSKGGTTIAGLNVLEKNEFQVIIKEAFNACVNRAYEL